MRNRWHPTEAPALENWCKDNVNLACDDLIKSTVIDVTIRNDKVLLVPVFVNDWDEVGRPRDFIVMLREYLDDSLNGDGTIDVEVSVAFEKFFRRLEKEIKSARKKFSNT